MQAQSVFARPAGFGVLAFVALLAVYVTALTLLSGWTYTTEQVAEFWVYIVPLAAGFGLQVALYVRLRDVVSRVKEAGVVVVASGTTSTAAMVSCCAHYLANVAPVLGASGLVAFAAHYQIEFFWLGLAFSAAGVAYVSVQLMRATKAHAQCAA